MTNPMTVLLVDDEPAILESIQNVLRRDRRIAPLSAESGPKALELIAERAVGEHEVAVVVSDYQMPLMNGLELMDAVRRRYPRIIRILLSARIDLKEVTDAFNRGLIYRFLAKPCPPEELLAAVQSAMRAAQALEESEQLLRQYEALKAQMDGLGRAVMATCMALRHDSQAARDGEFLAHALSGGQRNG